MIHCLQYLFHYALKFHCSYNDWLMVRITVKHEKTVKNWEWNSVDQNKIIDWIYFNFWDSHAVILKWIWVAYIKFNKVIIWKLIWVFFRIPQYSVVTFFFSDDWLLNKLQLITQSNFNYFNPIILFCLYIQNLFEIGRAGLLCIMISHSTLVLGKLM